MAEPNAPPGANDNSRTSIDRLKQVQNRIALAKEIRKTWRDKYDIETLYRYFYSDLADSILRDDESSSSFYVNKILPTIKTILPSLFLQNPVFVIRSKAQNTDPTSIIKAKMAEAALAEIANQDHHLEFSVKLAILQSFFSIGVLKCSYQPTLKKNPRAGEVMYERSEAGLPLLDENQEPAIVTDEDGMPLLEPDEIVDDETYRWDWVNGEKMLFPNAGPAHLRWPWLAEEVTVLLDEAREDERFPSNLRSQLRTNMASDDKDDYDYMPMDMQEYEKPDKYITYIELWDIRKGRQTIWAPGQTFSHSRFLLDRDTPEYIENHPYSMLLGYIPILGPKSCPWPMPYIYSWLSLQREHHVRRRQLITGANRTARKVFYEDSTFEDENDAVNFLKSSQDMQGVKVTDLTRPPVVHTDPPLPTNIAQDLNLLEADWAFETGVTGARIGGRNRGADSVFDSKVAVSSGEMRDLEMRHNVNIFLETAGKKMLRLLKSTMTIGMFIRLRGTNESSFMSYVALAYGDKIANNIKQYPGIRASFDQRFGDDRWLMLSPEDLDFESDLMVAPGSARPRNQESEKQDFFQILQLLSSPVGSVLTQSRALLNRVADMFEFFDASMIDEILAASQQAIALEQMKAGRMQGNENESGMGTQPAAATGNGANTSSFRRSFVG